MIKKRTLWMSFSSVHPWDDAAVWDEYLQSIETLFLDRLDKLDENDPVRRKANVKNGEGLYITNFEAGVRTLFGSFLKTKINFTMCYSKLGSEFIYNNIIFYIPVSEELSAGPALDRLIRFFNLTIEKLSAFTAESDFTEEVYSKKSHDGYSLDITTELIGVFWLTFFGTKYCDFFKRKTLLGLHGAVDGPANGITIRLAESPFQVGPNDRRDAETTLGKKYFAGLEPITDFNKRKAYGQLLTLEQLRC